MRHILWLSLAGVVGFGAPAAAQSSLACEKPKGQVQTLICADPELLSLEARMGETVARAMGVSDRRGQRRLASEQKEWAVGRDECWKSDAERACVVDDYQRRIAAIEATWRLAPGQGPAAYACDGAPKTPVVAEVFETEPRTLTADYDKKSYLLYEQFAGRFQGRGVTAQMRGTDLSIAFGFGTPLMRCLPIQSAAQP